MMIIMTMLMPEVVVTLLCLLQRRFAYFFLSVDFYEEECEHTVSFTDVVRYGAQYDLARWIQACTV